LEVNWEETNTGIGHLLLAYSYLIFNRILSILEYKISR